jgi:outer membrane autotransporter protein
MEKMKISTAVLTCLGVICSASALAQNTSPIYMDLGYTMLTYKEPKYEATPKALRLIVGHNLDDHFGIEGMAAASAGSSTSTLNGIKMDFSVPTMYGVYAKAFAKLESNFEVFGRLGWASVSRKATAPIGNLSLSYEDSASGFSYGAGAKYTISENTSVFADYVSYYPSKNGISIEGFTFGVGFSF